MPIKLEEVCWSAEALLRGIEGLDMLRPAGGGLEASVASSFLGGREGKIYERESGEPTGVFDEDWK